MKKVALLVLVVFSFRAQAQIEFGAKGGLNITNIVGKDVAYKSKAGIHIGGFAGIPLTKQFTLQPELVYSTQGGKWDSKDGGKTMLNYLQVPVLVKYTSRIGLFAETGPHIGFLLSAKDKYDGESNDIKKYLKTTDIGWQFGVGYRITPSLGANIRYNTSFTNFYVGEDDGDTWKERNSVLQIGVYYILHRTKR